MLAWSTCTCLAGPWDMLGLPSPIPDPQEARLDVLRGLKATILIKLCPLGASVSCTQRGHLKFPGVGSEGGCARCKDVLESHQLPC